MDSIKISFKYIKLSFLYLILFFLRFFALITIDDMDRSWFRKIKYFIPIGIGAIIAILCNIFLPEHFSFVFIIVPINFNRLSMIAIVIFLSLVILCIMLVVTMMLCAMEFELDKYIEREFNDSERRFGSKKDNCFMRSVSKKIRKYSIEFFSFGNIFSITAMLIFAAYIVSKDYGDISFAGSCASVFVFLFLIMQTILWKKRYNIYKDRNYEKEPERATKSTKYNKENYNKENYNKENYNKTFEKNEYFDNNGEKVYPTICCGFFNGCCTVKQVKNKYRELVKILHPDMGGDAEKFRMLDEEYEYVFKKWNISK